MSNHNTSAYIYHSNTWPTMCAFRPTIILFPNLRSLNWRQLGLNDDTFPSFLLSVGQSLEVLRLLPRPPSFNDAKSSTALQVAFQIIAERFHHLRSLVVDQLWIFDRMDLGLESAITSLALSLSSLESLICPRVPITIRAATALAQLAALKDLTMYLSDDAQWSTFSPDDLEPFKKLQTITLYITIPAYVSFGNALQLPHVNEVTIALCQYSEPHSIPGFFSSIRRQFSPSALKKLMICPTRGATGVGLARTPELTILPSHLRPLLEFKLMEDFTLSLHYGTSLEDTLLSDMATAWPKLRSLSIYCQDHVGARLHASETLPTIKVLAKLAMRCPDLRSIGLCGINAACWPTLAEFEADQAAQDLLNQLQQSPSPSQLQTLDFAMSPITAPECVAIFLAHAFPALSCVDYNYDRHFTREDSWRRVSFLLSQIQRIKQSAGQSISSGTSGEGS